MTHLSRSLVVLAGAAAAWIGVACLDVSSPISGIASISRIIVPTPSVVEHDSLRDTLGQAKPLQVYAFAANGDTVRDALVRFFVIDATHNLHVDSATGIVTGDSLAPNAAVFARVTPGNGKGSLDTPPDTIPVVPVPDSAVRDTNFVFTFDPLQSDTNSSALLSAPFGVAVRGHSEVSADTPVPRYLVGFELRRIPTPKSNDVGKTVVLTSALSTSDSSYAITDASGHATLRLRIRLRAIPAALLTGGVDTAVVKFHVRYKAELKIVPSDSIIITIQAKP